jgi:hypothetical protein
MLVTSSSRTHIRARPRLLVLRTLREGWRIVVAQRRELVSAGALPFAISECVALVLSNFESHSNDGGTRLVVGAISSIPLTAFEVGWYRLVLLKEPISWRGILAWSPVHSLFVGFNVATSAALSLPSMMSSGSRLRGLGRA